jgi:hypothetical protein
MRLSRLLLLFSVTGDASTIQSLPSGKYPHRIAARCIPETDAAVAAAGEDTAPGEGHGIHWAIMPTEACDLAAGVGIP